jgi:hypothetical protein
MSKFTKEQIIKAEKLRAEENQEINEKPVGRKELEKRYGQVWNTEEMRADFVVRGFLAPYMVVQRRRDGAIGSLKFQHSPRFYFEFELHEE